jgi:drug/metabolite transporter (DMT)-like permease
VKDSPVSQASRVPLAASNRNGVAVAFAVASAALYGLTPAFFRAGFDAGVPAVESALFRTTLMIAVTGVVVWLRRENIALRRAAWPSLVAQAAATATISLAYGASVQFIPVGLAVIVFYTWTVLKTSPNRLLSSVVAAHGARSF